MNPPHYPSLELCNKLTEIGFPETEKWYLWGWNDFNIIKNREWFLHWVSSFLCPSVMEMLDVIPKRIKEDEKIYRLEIAENGMWFYVKYIEHSMNPGKSLWHHNWTIPNALAEMILWLHENNHIKF